MTALKRHIYSVHGLILASELELPELPTTSIDAKSTPDVVIRIARLPHDLRMTATDVPDIFSCDSGLVLTVPGAARFQIRNGRDVFIEIDDNPDMALLRLYLFGSVMGMVCHQQGRFLLHASAVAREGKAIAFCGTPGAGKSTLAARCVEAGARLVADDMLVLSNLTSPIPMVNPGMPKFKLWRDAIEALGRTTAGLKQDWARAEKFHVPADRHLVTDPVRLSHIFILETDEGAGAGVVTPLSGAAVVSELVQNTYRPEYLDLANRRAAHFAECVMLSSTIKVSRLSRQRDAASLPKTATMLLDSCLGRP